MQGFTVKYSKAVAALCLAWAATSMAADLKVGFNAEVTSADPHVHQAQNRNVWMHVYEPLVKQDANLRPSPGLARGWRSTDPTTWVFTLRPGVQFHDGSPFEAEDAKVSIDRARNMTGAKSLRSYLRDIQSVTVVDAMTLQIKTNAPAPSTPDALSLVPILPRKIASSATEETFAQGKASVGTGPYKFVEWTRGQRVVLAKNDKYWGGAEPWDKVIFEFLLKEPARASGLLSGSVDVINGATASIVEALGRNPKLDSLGSAGYMLNFMYLDQRPVAQFVTDSNGKPISPNPLLNPKVRQAIAAAVNRDVIVKRVMKGDSVAAAQWVPEGFFGYDPSIKVPAADPTKAKTLLSEAGFANGFNLTVHCPNDRYLNDAKVCEAVAQMLTQVGIKTSVQTLPFAVLQPRMLNAPKPDQEISVAMTGAGAVFGDSQQVMVVYNMTHDAKKGTGGSNYGRYSNPQFDSLVLKANETLSSSEREELQRKAARVLAEDGAYIPIHHLKASYAFRKGLKVTPRSDGFIFAMDVRDTAAK